MSASLEGPHAKLAAGRVAAGTEADRAEQGDGGKILEAAAEHGRADISNDIEKDINIDVTMANNSGSTIQYISSITINYYNCEAAGKDSPRGKAQ